MKLLSFEEGNKTAKEATHVAVTIEIYDKSSLLYKRYKEEVVELENYELTFLIQQLKEGDSCNFMVPSSKIITAFKSTFFNETVPEYVEVAIKVHRYLTKAAYSTEKKVADKEMIEQLILTEYLKEVNATAYKGIYIEQLEEGQGGKVKKGSIITIAYRGCFVNRLEFDKISEATEFTFRYGSTGQVIEGLDIAINGMKKGEKSKIIISSQLAFGEEGSTTLVVPPFTTVIYELKIINVK